MNWTKSLPNALPILSWCADVEEGALKQAENLSRHPALVSHVALMPDCHVGYGMPIGGVVAADAAVIPAAVGVDIGCGMRAVETDLAFLPIEEPAEHDYFRDMLFALRYAEENRRRMMAAFKETVAEFAPEAAFVQEIDIHHNYAAFEEHAGRTVCVHRKGATSAKDGELGIIPGSMGAASYIVRGRGNPDSFASCSHGTGRRLGRIAACRTLTAEECDAALAGIVHGRWHPYRKFGKARGMLDLSEAPQAYKDIENVICSELDKAIRPMSAGRKRRVFSSNAKKHRIRCKTAAPPAFSPTP